MKLLRRSTRRRNKPGAAPTNHNHPATAAQHSHDSQETTTAGSRVRWPVAAATVAVLLLLLLLAAATTLLLRPGPPPGAALVTDVTPRLAQEGNLSCGSLEDMLPCRLENDSSTAECPRQYRPTQWRASPPNKLVAMQHPIKYVVVSHTAQSRCDNLASCSVLLRSMQAGHLKRRYDDLAYNFLVADDGSVYEARGWMRASSHLGARRYGNITLGVSFLGDYRRANLTTRQVASTAALLNYGVRCGYLDGDYLLVAHNQTLTTESPGALVFQEIRRWPHYSDVRLF